MFCFEKRLYDDTFLGKKAASDILENVQVQAENASHADHQQAWLSTAFSIWAILKHLF